MGRELLTIDVCIIEPSEPFICAAHGPTTTQKLIEIEKDLVDLDFNEDNYLTWADTLTYRVDWIPPQRGDWGLIELEGYWDLTLIAARRTAFGRA